MKLHHGSDYGPLIGVVAICELVSDILFPLSQSFIYWQNFHALVEVMLAQPGIQCKLTPNCSF